MSSAGGRGIGPDWACVEVLAEPTRRRIYDAVRDADGPLTRDDVARATGVGRRLAAFHLDRLAEAGLLDVDFARPAGRAGGPGAGRPAKRYRPAPTQIDVSVPPRRYDLAARILATAVAQSPTASDVAALGVAEREGERIGAGARRAGRRSPAELADALCGALEPLGYEPAVDEARVRLRNCPFHAVVDVSTELICGMNQRLVNGVLTGLGAEEALAARLDGVLPDCCVTVAPV